MDMIESEGYVGPDRRSRARREDEVKVIHLESIIENALKEALGDLKLVDAATHEAHHAYLEAVLKRENDRAAFRKAVIEKGTVTLVWSAIAFVFSQTYQQAIKFLAEHWK